MTVRIWEEGAKEPKTLLVRAFSEKRGGVPAAVAAWRARARGRSSTQDRRGSLPRTATDLRDRSIFPSFDPAEVKRARITGGGKVLVVDRGGDSEWKVVEPSRGPAKAPKVDNVLLTLKSLRWKDIVSPRARCRRYGLDKPELEMTLAKSGDAEVGTLVIGKRDGDVSYVRLKTAPAIYAVDDRLVADLRKASTDIPQ